MKSWVKKAEQNLRESLFPVPVEKNELDWKEMLSEKSNRLAMHLSAMSNLSGGGTLVFGINNDGKPKPLSKSEMDEIISRLGNIARMGLEPTVAIDHCVFDFEGNAILFIHIPESAVRPVHLKGKDIFESYTRSVGQTIRMSRQEIQTMILQSRGESFESLTALPGVESEELLNILDYESFFKLQKLQRPENNAGIIDFFKKEDLISENHDAFDLKNLGAILFARDLQSFPGIKRKAPRVIVYSGSGRLEATSEIEFEKGYASGFKELLRIIMNLLPGNEVIENTIREQVKLYPEISIREFVANALIHQDFQITGAGVMIEIFNDRLEITNPGAPLVETNRFIDAPPKSRNEILASFMRRLGICEERGSGIDRAIDAIEKFQLPAPKFVKGDGYTRVILYSPIPFAKMNKEDRIRACYQHTCLHYERNETVTNQSLRKRFNISKNNYPMASRILAETVEDGMIKPSDPDSNSKKFITYIPYWA